MSSNPIAPTTQATKAVADTNSAPGRGAPVAVEGFSLLLQAAEQPLEAGLQTLLQQAAVAQGPVQEPVDSAAVLDPAVDTGFLLGDAGWTVQSLVGQTAQMDGATEMALRDGSHVQQRLDSGMGALNTAAWGRHTASLGQPPVVAQGVAPATVAAEAASAMGNAMQGTAAQSAAMVAAVATDAVTKAGAQVLEAVSQWGAEASDEGRVSLQGQQWVAVDKHPGGVEQMQRLMGQMAQWVAASGAPEVSMARRGSVHTEGGAETAGVDASVAALGANSTRLTDNAVTAMVAGERAGQAGADTAASPTQDMSVWTAGKQQRAEMLLDRDGQPVRVQVLVQGNEAHVTFRSDEQTTRAMLDASVAQLRDMLAAQGLELAGVQVQQHSAGGHSDGQGGAQQEAFMPAGARTVQMQQPEEAVAGAQWATRVVQGLDVFA